jgi:hypothetical protein
VVEAKWVGDVIVASAALDSITVSVSEDQIAPRDPSIASRTIPRFIPDSFR